MHGHHGAEQLAASVTHGLAIGEQEVRCPVLRNYSHFGIPHPFTLQRAQQGYSLLGHRRYPVRLIQVVMVGPRFRGYGFFRQAVQRARGLVKPRQYALSVARDDRVRNVVEQRRQKQPLPRQFLGRPLAFGDVVHKNDKSRAIGQEGARHLDVDDFARLLAVSCFEALAAALADPFDARVDVGRRVDHVNVAGAKPEQGFAGVSEHRRSGVVGVDDAAIQIDQPVPVERRLQHRIDAVTARLQFSFRPLARADVAEGYAAD